MPIRKAVAQRRNSEDVRCNGQAFELRDARPNTGTHTERASVKTPAGSVAIGAMKIEWPVLAAAVSAIVLAYVLLLRMIRARSCALTKLEAENQLLRSELLQTRSHAAKEIAELCEENAKRVKALQRNLSDVTATLKHGGAEWRR